MKYKSEHLEAILDCALQAHKIQLPEMATAAKPSQQPRVIVG